MIIVKCKNCGKEIHTYSSRLKRKHFCSHSCRSSFYMRGNKYAVGNKVWIGKRHTEKSKEKMRIANKGKRYSPETEFKKGQIPWNKGKEFIKIRGEKNPSWQGGKSFEPYSVDWTETLRRSIRERDHYICKKCNKIQGDIAYDVHHIDYNKKNCNPDNLITLCHKCNSIVNANRKYWANYFRDLVAVTNNI